MVGTEFGLVFGDKNLGERLKIGLDYFFPFGYWTFWERGPDHLLLCTLTHSHSLIVLVIVFESDSLSLSLSLFFYNYLGSDHKAQPLLTSGSAWLNRHNWGVCFLLGLFVFVFWGLYV